MDRVARAQYLWMGRRLALLAGSALVSAGAFGIQLTRLRLEPNGAAVHGVALLVTIGVLAILLRLIRHQLGGPGLDAPSWERHEHRVSLREAPLVALIGTGVAALLAVATPRLVAEERLPAATPLAVSVDPRRPTPTPPAEVAVAPKSSPVALPSRYQGPSFESLQPMVHRPVEVNFRWLEGAQDPEPQEFGQDPIDPTRPDRDAILLVQPEPPVLPPLHVGAGVMVVTAQGVVEVQGDLGRFELDLERIRGEQSFEAGVDLGVEFALTPESSLKLMYAGTAIFERGHLAETTTLGSVTAAAGDTYEFEMTWSHLYMALAKRLTGYTRGSWFDLSIHGGAMVDHTIVEFESSASGVKAESDLDERGWVAPGVGISMAFRGPGGAGFVFELVQSVPVNIGGQAILLTDIRTGVTVDITENFASVFIGYRYVHSAYRLFDDPLVRSGGTTVTELAIRGPVLGLDFRF